MYVFLESVIRFGIFILVLTAIALLIMYGIHMIMRKKVKQKIISKKIFKSTAIMAIILLIAVFIFYLIYFFGWRMFGYDACKLTNGITVANVVEKNETLVFRLTTFYKTRYLTGDYIYEINGEELIIGFHTQSRFIFPCFGELPPDNVEQAPIASINVPVNDLDNIKKIRIEYGQEKPIVFTKEKDGWHLHNLLTQEEQ